MDMTWFAGCIFWATWTHNLARVFLFHDLFALMQTTLFLWIIDNISDNKISFRNQPGREETGLEHSWEIIHKSLEGLEQLMKEQKVEDADMSSERDSELNTIGDIQSSVRSEEILLEDKQETEKLELTKELVVDLHRTSPSWRNSLWSRKSKK